MVEPIRFVPRRLHVYLNHHASVYFLRIYSEDEYLEAILRKLEARNQYFFGDIVQLRREYLSEFLSNEQIDYLRKKLQLVEGFDIEMKVPGWIRPMPRDQTR